MPSLDQSQFTQLDAATVDVEADVDQRMFGLCPVRGTSEHLLQRISSKGTTLTSNVIGERDNDNSNNNVY